MRRFMTRERHEAPLNEINQNDNQPQNNIQPQILPRPLDENAIQHQNEIPVGAVNIELPMNQNLVAPPMLIDDNDEELLQQLEDDIIQELQNENLWG